MASAPITAMNSLSIALSFAAIPAGGHRREVSVHD
jgi:hypothetical protein